MNMAALHGRVMRAHWRRLGRHSDALKSVGIGSKLSGGDVDPHQRVLGHQGLCTACDGETLLQSFGGGGSSRQGSSIDKE
jgi:hypothetical protein